MTTPQPNRNLSRRPKNLVPATATDQLLGDIRSLIEGARQQLARTVDSTMVALYWHIGKRIREDVLANDRAEYGRQILQTLSKKLAAEYGRGYSLTNLSWMTRFAEVFADEQIVAALSRQLSWSHFVQIIPLDNPLKRDFYAEMCRLEHWSVRTLRHKIDHLLFERTAVAKKPEKLIEQDLAALRDEDRLTPDLVFRDPYLLDFLGLAGSYSEKDVEQAVLREDQVPVLVVANVHWIGCIHYAVRGTDTVNDERQQVYPPRERAQRTDAIFAPKGPNISAQGKATRVLRALPPPWVRFPWFPQPCKGETRGGDRICLCRALTGLRSVAPSVPRAALRSSRCSALPWADMFRPLRGEKTPRLAPK